MTTIEVSKLTGASLRQLQFWDEQGIVTPRLNDLGNREYDARATRDAVIAAHLRRKGITRLWQVERILKAVGKRHGVLVVPASNKETIQIQPDHRSAAVAAEKCFGPVIIINIQPIESEVQ